MKRKGEVKEETTSTAPKQMSDEELDELLKSSTRTKTEDENGFNKMNTNFYVRKGEEKEIVFLSEMPYNIQAHRLVMTSKNGKKYYPIEACQKSGQTYCILCDEAKKRGSNSSVGLAYPTLFYLILDLDGDYDAKTEEYSGIPRVRFFQTPPSLATKILRLKSENEGLGNAIFKVFKEDKDRANTEIDISLIKEGYGREASYKVAYYDGEIPETLPDFGKIYPVLPDTELEQKLQYLSKES